ncbi:adenosine receptor A3-like [Lytechinus variegatus]|uniref:adenosine receptor A3-like n=1 Tax=Lytechinus variegatus TaxID=7654 RepID=UPI001BB1A84A|nr:adenosine receptor A3-like [Lytechinus variegatus]
MADPLRTYIYHAAMFVFPSLGTVINLATVCAILLNKALRKEQHIFTFSLALADCISAFAMFISNLFEFLEISFEMGADSWTRCLFVTGLVISILSTLAIAFERLIILRIDALGSRRIVTAKRSIAVCMVVWIVVSAVYFLLHGFSRAAVSYTLIYFISPCIVLASLFIMAICYILIYKKIARISENVGLNDAALQRRAKNSKKVLVTFALVVASTSACWAIMVFFLVVEYIYSLIVKNHQGQLEIHWSILFDIGDILVSINGILNPVIIWLRLTDFRAQLRASFERLGCRKSQNSSQVTSDPTTTVTNRSVSTIDITMDDIEAN